MANTSQRKVISKNQTLQKEIRKLNYPGLISIAIDDPLKSIKVAQDEYYTM